MMTPIARSILLSAVSLFWLTTGLTHAGKGPMYGYGEAWWQEYRDDKQTELLLHFGPPQVSARETLRGDLDRKKQDETLGVDLNELDDLEDEGGIGDIPAMSPDAFKKPDVDESKTPANTVLDYSPNRRRLMLGAGLKRVDGGRFGQGLACDGGGSLRVPLSSPRMIECWFKATQVPKAPVCIFSSGNDEMRVLLHPDLHLELKLRKPHGNPGTNPNRQGPTAEAQLALLMARDATIRSPDPVLLNTWVHVVIWDKPHPTPGGGEPWDAQLKVNGFDVAWYLSERYNDYQFFGGRAPELVIGNSAAGDQGFVGIVDEVRVSLRTRVHYERPGLAWRDLDSRRPLSFDRPYFREDGTLFHAPLDKGVAYERSRSGDESVALDLKGLGVQGLETPGIRGKGWTLDPLIGLPRFPVPGMSPVNGSFEFWLRPVNWDDVTGYWQHSPPKQMQLSVARFFGRDRRSGETVKYMEITLPRAFNLERQRLPLDPGHWSHLMAVWAGEEAKWGTLYLNAKRIGGFRRPDQATIRNIEPLYVEVGVSDDVTVINGERPLVQIDEVVGYDWALMDDEVEQAYRRWQGPLEPIKLYRDDLAFKYSIQRLSFSVRPLLPAGIEPATCAVQLTRKDLDKPLFSDDALPLVDQQFQAVLSDGQRLPEGAYAVTFKIKSADGTVVAQGQRQWDYQIEPWRNFDGGIVAKTPAPWTPITVDGKQIQTRMTRYVLADDGLPAEIHADGENLLAGRIHFLEDGKPMVGKAMTMGTSEGVSLGWTSTFEGKTATIQMQCHAEYDGMVRYELRVQPKGKLAPITMRVPVKREYASHYLYYNTGDRGVKTGLVPAANGRFLESRVPHAPYAAWRDYQRARQEDAALTWDAYWAPIRDATEAYGFFTHFDLHNMDRGLWWFCDNAAGWWQSKTTSAIEMVRQGDQIMVDLNLIAEPVDYELGTPIVFAFLPHPARPLPEKYRQFERIPATVDNRASSIYDAFRPWPMDPKAGNMCLFPASDPSKPEDGPSWDYAEKCLPHMRAAKPTGLRTLYLSRAWFSCRAGAYDHWEWRSGGSGAVSLTPSFVNYLCWEMNEWIKRGIWEAIYLDECYETPANNLLAGFSVRLPDGSEQPGVTNFAFRELMKRWRNIFHQNGKEPIVIAHHTYSWQYHGLVFCDSTLDGENAPIVSLNGRDWIDSTSKHRYETLQNARLWGISTFYMPFIAEGGFDDKERSQYPKWQWRMARQAQSMFAHYETATVYEGQGAQVYKTYWQDLFAWGAEDPDVPFHPYWEKNEAVQMPDNGVSLLVSYYQKDGDLLLVASNRAQQPATARITLDRAKLGLAANAEAVEWDHAFDPPPGDDYLGKAAVSQETAELLDRTSALIADGPDGVDDLLAEEDIEDMLVDPEEKRQAERGAWHPVLEDNLLTVPIRGRDFRLIRIH